MCLVGKVGAQTGAKACLKCCDCVVRVWRLWFIAMVPRWVCVGGLREFVVCFVEVADVSVPLIIEPALVVGICRWRLGETDCVP